MTGLSVGALALKPRRGWVSLLVGNSVGATAARWLLPLMIAIPIVVAWLALRGSDIGLYPADFRLALTTAVTVVLLGTLALWGSWQLDSLVAIRRSAEVLRENEATLRAFFETEGLFASVVERRGDEVRYLFANRALSGLFGRSYVTGLTQHDLVNVAAAQTMAEGLRAIEASGAPSIAEVPQDAGDEQRWFLVTTSPIADSPADAPRFTTASFEITERKRAEAHQQTLLQELNHRVKNTLAIVQSLASQTVRGDQATPAARQTFEQRLAAVAAANSCSSARTGRRCRSARSSPTRWDLPAAPIRRASMSRDRTLRCRPERRSRLPSRCTSCAPTRSSTERCRTRAVTLRSIDRSSPASRDGFA